MTVLIWVFFRLFILCTFYYYNRSLGMQLYFLLDVDMCYQKPGNESNMDLGMQNIRTANYALEERIATVLLCVLLPLLKTNYSFNSAI